jgi:hypothetical protein
MYSMGAHLVHASRPYSFLKKNGADSTEAEASKMLFWRNWSLTERNPVQDSNRKSWAVCPHLSSFEGLFDYYMASGPIMILLGKCFCHDCYGKALSKEGLAEFMESCHHMTDRNFQDDFIAPLFQINREVFRTIRNYTCEESTQWTWISCPHVCKEGQLEGLYTKCNPIFFHEGFVTCNECRYVIPSASLYLQTLLDCEAMTDAQLQERVIDQLFPINREVLEAVGHYDR